MSIWSRLGNLINSYVNDLGGDFTQRQTDGGFKSYNSDPDIDEAYEELNDFLNQGQKRTGNTGETARQSARSSGVKLPPEELRPDFECLGVSFGADAETCKAAYKKLLKIHHPDRHAGHEGNFKKATERSAKINAAWDRIEKWRKEA